MQSPISPEFQLAIACCRSVFADDDHGAGHEIDATIDWRRFARLARFHRIQGLVWNGLTSIRAEIPPASTQALRSDAEAIAVENLRIAVETKALRARFEEAGVALLFVKGLTVGALAYAKPMLKMGWDIDLLIDAKQLAEAASLLRARGYRQLIPAPATNLESWHNLRKESVWNRDDGLYVELHTRLADNPALIPAIDVHSPSREVEIAPGIALPTLTEDELFAYLCVHGASSLWFRLKWITDLAAILHGVPSSGIERLYERSQELGAGRSSGIALLLADELYGTLGGSDLRMELTRDRSTRWLLAAALRQLAGRDEPAEPTSVVGGTAAMHLAQFLLLPGLAFKFSELSRQARSVFG